ncbi:MAG: helix-turn-helix transcriptional regulator [Aquabacterium sp.]|nr:helix-turn-helix transcriptional regulator [Aquabacterium sp.]
MNSPPELGLEVARLRRERSMTQQELATLSGLGQSTLARFETGGCRTQARTGAKRQVLPARAGKAGCLG